MRSNGSRRASASALSRGRGEWGYEAVHMIRKGQVRSLPKGDIAEQVHVLKYMFALSASSADAITACFAPWDLFETESASGKNAISEHILFEADQIVCALAFPDKVTYSFNRLNITFRLTAR